VSALRSTAYVAPWRGIEPRIDPTAWLAPNATVIGDVEIGAGASLWFGVVARGDVNHIRIGARTNIQDGTVIHGVHPQEARDGGHAITIGDDVTIGHSSIVHGCAIESRCLIGMGSTLLDGAVLRSGVFLGAGSLVTEGKELEGGYLWLGRPAKRLRPLTDEEWKWFEHSARHYVHLKDDYL